MATAKIPILDVPLSALFTTVATEHVEHSHHYLGRSFGSEIGGESSLEAVRSNHRITSTPSPYSSSAPIFTSNPSDVIAAFVRQVP
jgi:hypothetical protein